MADVAKITLPNGTTKDIKDATARNDISSEFNRTGYKNLSTVYSGSCGSGGAFPIQSTPIELPQGTYVCVFNNTATTSTGSLNFYDSNGALIPSHGVTFTNSSKVVVEFTITVDTVAKFSIYNNAATTISNLMICTKSDYTNSPTFEKHALSNTIITPELIELVDSGAKNKYAYPNDTKTGSSYTWIDNPIDLDLGVYVLTFETLTTTAVSGVCQIAFLDADKSTTPVSGWLFVDTNNKVPKQFTISNKKAAYLRIYAGNSAAESIGQTVSYTNAMVCSKAAWDVSQKYVPYVMNNAELTKLTPVTLSKRHIPQSADYEIVSDLTISIPGGKKYLIHAMAMFSNVAPKGVIINKTNTIAANKNTVYAEITNDTNDFGGLTTSAIMSNTGSTAFDICIFAKFKSANTSGSDVIVTYQDIT